MDFIGKKNIMITLSLIVILVGIVSIISHKGLKYGVDFEGGNNLIIKFKENVSNSKLANIRKLLKDNSIKANLQLYGTLENEKKRIKIVTKVLKKTDSNIEKIIVDLFHSYFDKFDKDAVDINMLKSNKELATELKNYYLNSVVDYIIEKRPFKNIDELSNNLSLFRINADIVKKEFILKEPEITQVQVNINSLNKNLLFKKFKLFYENVDFEKLATEVNEVIDKKGGIAEISDFKSELNLNDFLYDKLTKYYKTGSFIVETNNFVGPKIGKDYRNKAVYAIIFALIGMIIYISWRFEFKFAVGAILALIHDVLITIGIFSILDKEFTTQIVAAILTIIGYSLNDTIVVYDRIRENLKLFGSLKLSAVINKSIMQSMSRTLMTSLTTLVAVLSLYIFGGEVYRNFSIALLIGVVVGTYSSIFIASPVLVMWKSKKK